MTEEEDTVFSFPEWQATTFSLDCTGTRVVLAVQKWLAVVKLNQSEMVSEPRASRKLGRQNKYDIKAVSWNPHSAREDLLASTCQQKLEIWNVEAERHPLVYSIKAHTRPVSDLGWSLSDPNLLASCAVDSYIHVWDIRDVKRPKTSFKAVAGASLVQWNKVNGNILASVHDSDIRIWDMRKPTTASGYITAHMSRIHDLDWSYSHENQLTTCSHDATVKFWDTLSPREPISVIKAGSQPLWRARNYPIGNAVAMVLVPAMHGGDSRVFLWSRNNIASPHHIFKGSSEPVLEIQWRKFKGGWDLVTWSKDRTLHIWSISEQLQMELGADSLNDDFVGEEMIEDSWDVSGQDEETNVSSGTEAVAIDQTDGRQDSLDSPMLTRSREVPLSSSFSRSPIKSVGSFTRIDSSGSFGKSSSSNQIFQPQVAYTLAQEFSLLNLDIDSRLKIETTDLSERSCTVKVEQGGYLVRVKISFPSHYPNGAAPSFTFDKSSSIDTATSQDLYKIMKETAGSSVKQNRPCLQQCLKKLTKTLETYIARPPPPTKQPDLFGHLDDEQIPFPRTSGARFSPTGLLVCFNSVSDLAYLDVPKTPRSLDKMNVYRSRIRPVARGGPIRWSGHSYITSALPSRGSSGSNLAGLTGGMSSSHAGDKGVNPGLVTVYDALPLLPIDYNLAKLYSMNCIDLKELCTTNASVAAQYGRMDLVQTWSTALLIADLGMKSPDSPDSGVPWPEHPFGKNLIHSLFDHFGKLHDIQTLAMLACLFQVHCIHFDSSIKKGFKKQGPAKNHSHPCTPNGNLHGNHVSVVKSLPLAISPPKRSQAYSPTDRWSTGFMEKPDKPSPISSSWHEVGEGDFEIDDDEHLMEEEDTHLLKCRLLDDLLTRQCDEYCRVYADVLYAWGLLEHRAEVLKHQVSMQENRNMEIGFVSKCRKCDEIVRGPSCSKSRCFAFTCCICNLAVRGSSSFCLSCGHGGHACHMMDWFSKYFFCPTGCGCVCLEASRWT